MASSPQRLFLALEAQYRLPSGYLSRLYQVESSGGRNLYNKDSGAAGPFQFMPKTAKQYGLEDPYDLEESAKAAARLAADNRNALVKSGVQDPSAGVLYLAHQQGATGAVKLLSNADKPASALVGEKAVVQNAGKKDASAGEFASGIVGKFEGREQQKALQPYSALGEASDLLEAAPVPETLSPRGSRAREAYALSALSGLAQDLQPKAAPMLPIPRLGFAKGGIVSLVDGPEAAPAAGKGISVPQTTELVVREVNEIAKKGDLDIHKIAFLLRIAATNTLPRERSYEFASEIEAGDVPALMNRFRRYPRSLRILARLDLALGGLAGQGYGVVANQHGRIDPQPTKRMGHDTKVAKSFADGGEASGLNPAAMSDLSRYAIAVHGPQVGANMIRRSQEIPDKLFFALNQYSKNVFGPTSPRYRKELKDLNSIAAKHKLKPVLDYNRTEDALETEQELDRMIRDVPKKDATFRKALLRMKAMIGWKPKRRGTKNGR
jgi:hypothetical protein